MLLNNLPWPPCSDGCPLTNAQVEPILGEKTGKARGVLMQNSEVFPLEKKKQSQLTLTPGKGCSRDLMKFTHTKKIIIIANSEHWLQTKVGTSNPEGV